jgi:transcriptional/translational regulatory protein YebC/TACO1
MNPELREKDIAVLQAIQNGASDTREIHEATILTTREINYSLTEKSLQQMNLVEIHQPEGRETREINGHQTNVWKPKKVGLTDEGIQTLADLDDVQHQYEDMSREELIQTTHQLEERLDRLETMFKNFRSKVMDRL